MLVKREIPKEVINYEMCKKCGGRCCITSPCMYLPSDFKDLPIEAIEAIEEEILSNYAIIDQGKWPDSEELIYYLRIRTTREDLTREENILNKENIFIAKQRNDKCCLYYKLPQQYYLGIKYDSYDEEKIRSLSNLELEKLFRIKNEKDKERLGYTLPLEESIITYLEKRRTLSWGGCLLPEEKRPGGALYLIPNYVDKDIRCTQSKEFFDDNWDKPIHQEKLKTILSKNGII